MFCWIAAAAVLERTRYNVGTVKGWTRLVLWFDNWKHLPICLEGIGKDYCGRSTIRYLMSCLKTVVVSPYLLFHSSLQQHHDAGLYRQSDLSAAALQVLVQSRSKCWLLSPRIYRENRNTFILIMFTSSINWKHHALKIKDVNNRRSIHLWLIKTNYCKHYILLPKPPSSCLFPSHCSWKRQMNQVGEIWEVLLMAHMLGHQVCLPHVCSQENITTTIYSTQAPDFQAQTRMKTIKSL